MSFSPYRILWRPLALSLPMCIVLITAVALLARITRQQTLVLSLEMFVVYQILHKMFVRGWARCVKMLVIQQPRHRGALVVQRNVARQQQPVVLAPEELVVLVVANLGRLPVELAL